MKIYNDKNNMENISKIENNNASIMSNLSNITKGFEMPKYMENISKIENNNASIMSNLSNITKGVEIPKYMENIWKIQNNNAIMMSNLSNIIKGFEMPKYMENIWKIESNNASIMSNLSNIIKRFEMPKYMESIWKIQNNNASMMSNFNNIAKALESSNFIKEINKIDFNSVQINTNGTISYLDKIVNIEDELTETMNDFSIYVNNNISYEERIKSFVERIKIKHPIVVFIIVMFLIAPFYEYYLDCAKNIIDSKMREIEVIYKISSNKNKTIKDIKKEITTEVNLNYYEDKNLKRALSEYRVVKADSLNVRISNCTNSKVIYNLKFADIVKILKKKKTGL